MEFILQFNDETKVLWEPLIQESVATNVVVLVDASCGTGYATDSLSAYSICMYESQFIYVMVI